MYFATPIPWWLALLAVAGIVAFAVAAYRRPLVPVTAFQRRALISLRALALLALLALIGRPVLLLPPTNAGDVVVPVLIDTSRSMRIEDADGASRLTRAESVAQQMQQALAASTTVDLLSFSDQIAPATPASLHPEGRRTRLQSAIDAVRTRYRGRRLPGIVVLSDGGQSGASSPVGASEGASVPIFAVGIGSPEGVPDREVTAIAAGDPRLDQAAADLRVSVVSRGFGRDPFQLKVLADGQVVETRRITPAGDGSTQDELFTIFPNSTRASLFTAEVDAGEREAVLENNHRSLALSPAGRRRRLLVLAGAPGYEHSFLLRALEQDPGIDVDAIVRKGKNDANQDTFLVQAGGDRAATLTSGFPATRERLFAYDAVIVSNLEGEFFTRDQLTALAAFVGERGGGLLLMGGRSFERSGLAGTPLEEVLPVELTDRRGGQVTGAVGDDGPTGRQAITLTDDGLRHSVMRIGARSDQLKTLWATLPPLASAAPLGGPRPGALVLAVTNAANGQPLPLVAVQKYGRGRSMTFAGEASWRWRMLQPATDRRYDFFWRQAARWLANDAPEPVSLSLPDGLEAGDDFALQVETRDQTFTPVDGAQVEVRLTTPGGETTVLTTRAAGSGRVSAAGSVSVSGVYRVQAEARRNGVSLGADDRWVMVGDNASEFSDPRLNEGTLQRLVRDTGGRYVRAAAASSIVADIVRAVPAMLMPQQRDLWHEPWTFAIVMLLLSAEWILRRRWGLR